SLRRLKGRIDLDRVFGPTKIAELVFPRQKC
ncbi:MAG: hypothetical protein ACI87E_001359, partial [Mariniblastus sp.]